MIGVGDANNSNQSWDSVAPRGASTEDVADTQSAQASMSLAISTLRLQSRGFLQSDRFIDAMGMGGSQLPLDRDKTLGRVGSKLARVFEALEKHRSAK